MHESISEFRLRAIAKMTNVYDRAVEALGTTCYDRSALSRFSKAADQCQLSKPNVQSLLTLAEVLCQEDEQLRWWHSELVGLVWEELTEVNPATRKFIDLQYDRVRADLKQPWASTKLKQYECIYRATCGDHLISFATGETEEGQTGPKVPVYVSSSQMARLWLDTVNPLSSISPVDDDAIAHACLMHAFAVRSLSE